MILHYCQAIPFKLHPLYIRVCSEFRKNDADAKFIALLTDYTAFIYPRTIAFSVFGYSNKILAPRFSIHESQEDFALGFEDCAGDERDFISSEDCVELFKLLIAALDTIGLNHILVLDLFGANAIDMVVINHLYEVIAKNKSVIKLIVLAAEKFIKIISNNLISEDVSLVSTERDMFDNIMEMVRSDEYTYHLSIELPATIDAIESAMKTSSFYDNIARSLRLVIEFTGLGYISFFALNYINVLIHSLSHGYGLITEIEENELTKKNRDYLCEYHFFDINRWRTKKDKWIVSTGNNPGYVGTFMFNQRTYKMIASGF